MTSTFQRLSGNWKTAVVCFVLFILSFAVLRIFLIRPADLYDEGLILVGSWRVAQGQIPYRDFWTVYSPGQFYAVAAFFKLFGTTIESERLWDLLCRCILPVLGYIVAVDVTSRRKALLAWLLLLGCTAHFLGAASPTLPALVFSFAFVAFLSAFFAGGKAGTLAGAGLSIGLVAVFRMDFGLYCLLAATVVLPLHRGFEKKEGVPGSLGRRELYVVLCAAIAWVPVAIFFLAKVPLSVLTYDLITFPLQVFPRVRGVPFPSLSIPDTLYVYAPFLVFAIGTFLFGVYSKAVPVDRKLTATLAMASLLGILFINQSRVRMDESHAAPYIFLAVLVGSILIVQTPVVSGAKNLLLGSRLLCAAALAAALIQPFGETISFAGKLEAVAGQGSGLPRAPSIILSKETVNIVKIIDANTQPGEYIYVGVTTHDRISSNEPLFYFLCDRECPTKYDELHPGQATTAIVQREIVADLDRHHVDWILLTNQPNQEPNEGSISSGVHLLDDYIRDNFQVVTQNARHLILKRK